MKQWLWNQITYSYREAKLDVDLPRKHPAFNSLHERREWKVRCFKDVSKSAFKLLYGAQVQNTAFEANLKIVCTLSSSLRIEMVVSPDWA